MQICLCINNGYTMPCGVLMYSICLTNPNTHITFHILHDGVVAENRRLLADIAEKAGNACSFYLIEPEQRARLPSLSASLAAHWGVTTLYRLFISELLPVTVEKTLYLDCDMLCVDALDELWNLDMQGYPVAATLDHHCDDVLYTNVFGEHYDMTKGFFNAGMLVINLTYWREKKSAQHVLNTLMTNIDHFRIPDQDALNLSFFEARKLVSFRFNCQVFDRVETLQVRKKFHADVIDGQMNPAVVHFVWAIKPWHKECRHPYKQLWREVKKKTVWHNQPETTMYKGWMRFLLIRFCKELSILLIGRYNLSRLGVLQADKRLNEEAVQRVPLVSGRVFAQESSTSKN